VDKRKNKGAKWKQNISRSLRNKSKGLRKKASTAARKGVIKGSEAAGYVAGRGGTEIATRPRVANAVGKALDVADKAVSKLPKGNSKRKSKSKYKPNIRDAVTATKAVGAFSEGSVTGVYDGLKAAEKRERRKNDKKKKR
jgi:predicted nucleotidyltransferase